MVVVASRTALSFLAETANGPLVPRDCRAVRRIHLRPAMEEIRVQTNAVTSTQDG